MNPIEAIEREQLQIQRPGFQAGDTVRVHVKVVEGEKERIQVFAGVVIRKSRGGIRSTFTVRKVSYGVGVERTLPVHSPRIDKIEVSDARPRPARQALLPARSFRQSRPHHGRKDRQRGRRGAAAPRAPRPAHGLASGCPSLARAQHVDVGARRGDTAVAVQQRAVVHHQRARLDGAAQRAARDRSRRARRRPRSPRRVPARPAWSREWCRVRSRTRRSRACRRRALRRAVGRRSASGQQKLSLPLTSDSASEHGAHAAAAVVGIRRAARRSRLPGALAAASRKVHGRRFQIPTATSSSHTGNT